MNLFAKELNDDLHSIPQDIYRKLELINEFSEVTEYKINT